MGQSKSKTIEDLSKLLSGVAENERKIATTERLLCDCLIVLCTKDGAGHKTVCYEDDEVLGNAKFILDECYKVVTERDKLKAQVEILEKKKETVQFPVYISWWKALFGRRKVGTEIEGEKEKQ